MLSAAGVPGWLLRALPWVRALEAARFGGDWLEVRRLEVHRGWLAVEADVKGT